jgi:DNA-binding response OmpR family regulator
MSDSSKILGSRILVVEDNFLLAEVVGDFLTECDMEVVGPACGLNIGLVYAREAVLDGALIDINLNGRLCFPICDVLRERGIPFAFLTGYSDLALVPQRYRDVPLVAKPFEPMEMKTAIMAMLSGQLDGPLAFAASTVRKPDANFGK